MYIYGRRLYRCEIWLNYGRWGNCWWIERKELSLQYSNDIYDTNLWYKNRMIKAQNHSWKVIMSMWRMRSHGRVGREVRRYSKKSAVAKGTINMLMSYKQVWRDWMILWKESSAREMETVVFFHALQSFYSSILIKFPRIVSLIRNVFLSLTQQ